MSLQEIEKHNIVDGIIFETILPQVFKTADNNIKKGIEINLAEDMVNFVKDILVKTIYSEQVKKVAKQMKMAEERKTSSRYKSRNTKITELKPI